jgi:hypothetical protein
MATGMREKTTNVGGIIKRIWYAMTGTTQGAELASLDEDGLFKAKQFAVSTLNTAPASTTATGITGEIEVTPGGIYYCTATNTWKKALNVEANTETLTGLTSTFMAVSLPAINADSKYIWMINSGSNYAIFEATHNIFAGNNVFSLATGATVQIVTANSVFSFRLGNSVIEVQFNTSTAVASFRVVSGTITSITINRTKIIPVW